MKWPGPARRDNAFWIMSGTPKASQKLLACKRFSTSNIAIIQMDEILRVEMQARLVHLIRLLKIDTIVCYDPWGIYEENPDHYVTAQVVEAACWMARMDSRFPEQLVAGLQPHAVKKKYYFARGPQSGCGYFFVDRSQSRSQSRQQNSRTWRRKRRSTALQTCQPEIAPSGSRRRRPPCRARTN